MTGFKDIKIVGMDDAATKPVLGTKMVEVVLDLSSAPPSGMADYFAIAWKGHIFSSKRKVRIVHSKVLVTCVLNEVQEHITEINKILAEAGNAYSIQQIEVQRRAEARAAKEADSRSEISALKNTLKFD